MLIHVLYISVAVNCLGLSYGTLTVKVLAKVQVMGAVPVTVKETGSDPDQRMVTVMVLVRATVPVLVSDPVMVSVQVTDTVSVVVKVTVMVTEMEMEIVNSKLSCIKKLTYREVNYESNYSKRI